MSPDDVVTGGEALPNKLPKENPNLKGNGYPPDLAVVLSRNTLAELVVQGLDRKLPRWLKHPRKDVRASSRRGVHPCNAPKEVSPLIPLHRPQLSTEWDEPLPRAECLGHRGLRLKGDGKEVREAGLEGPPPCHQSSQNLVDRPSRMSCCAPRHSRSFTFWRAFQNCDPGPWASTRRSLV